jgi:hypothetical protein
MLWPLHDDALDEVVNAHRQMSVIGGKLMPVTSSAYRTLNQGHLYDSCSHAGPYQAAAASWVLINA